VKIFEERPYVKVTGLILNQTTQRLMLQDTTYSVLVNGVQTTNFKIDKSSASFEVKLPLGKKYTLEPRMENWNGLSSDLDLSNIREYAEAKINLYFSSIPFMLVKGKIIDEQKGHIIPLALKPIVLINGEISDSINYDYFSSSFSALLPLGEKYTFSAKVKNYNTGAVVVDVSSVSTFVERDISIPVKSVPWVEIRGKVIDNITLSPLSQETLPKVLINGQIADSIQIDANDGSFVFRLPFGYSYTMGVQTKDYKVNESVIDLTKYNEFAEITKNIYAERVDANMVVLSGKIINTKSESKLDEIIEVKMRVNGMETPAFAYNSTAGTYVLKLPVGFNYDLTPSVLNFYNKFEPLDLTKAVPLSKISRDFYVTPIEIGQSVDIQDIYFQTGKAILKPESFRSLNAIIQFLNEYPNVKVEIGGHTDNVGTASVNLKISQDRATSVADYVISQGIPAERVISKGYGFSKPKASNKTEAGKAQNRRVDFTITGI
jgi:outer membrane protein OmpA-like peptidoglycan-associated protein